MAICPRPAEKRHVGVCRGKPAVALFSPGAKALTSGTRLLQKERRERGDVWDAGGAWDRVCRQRHGQIAICPYKRPRVPQPDGRVFTLPYVRCVRSSSLIQNPKPKTQHPKPNTRLRRQPDGAWSDDGAEREAQHGNRAIVREGLAGDLALAGDA